MSACWKNLKEKQMKLILTFWCLRAVHFHTNQLEILVVQLRVAVVGTVDEGYSEAGAFHCVIFPSLQF